MTRTPDSSPKLWFVIRLRRWRPRCRLLSEHVMERCRSHVSSMSLDHWHTKTEPPS